MPSPKVQLKFKDQIAALGEVAQNPTEHRARRGARYRIYVRMSTSREFTISKDDQIDYCHNKAAREGWVEAGEPIFDDGLSGKEFTKRSIGKMISEVENGDYDIILVWKVSRWGRNLLDSLLNIKELHKVNGALASATEDLNSIDTAFGKFSLMQMLAIAELQLDQIRDSWMDAHMRRVRLGLPHCGGERFGYVYYGSLIGGRNERHLDEEAEDGSFMQGYKVHPVLGPVLASMYRDYIHGKSFKAIAERVNAEGHRTPLGNLWTYTTVKQVLDAGFGAGIVLYRKAKHAGAHHQVITDSEWNQYVLRRLESKETHPRTLGQEAILKRFVYCEPCGRRMALVKHKQTKGGKVYEYAKWRCNAQNGCGYGHAINNKILEELVLDWLREGAMDRVADATDALARKAPAQDLSREIKETDQEIKRYKSMISNLNDMFTNPKFRMSEAEYFEKKDEYLASLQGLEAKVVRLRRDAEVSTMPSSAVFGSLYAGWGLMDVATMNTVLDNVLSKVVVGLPQQEGPRVKIVPKMVVSSLVDAA